MVTLVFESASKTEVLTHLSAYPMVKAGLLEIDLIEQGHRAPTSLDPRRVDTVAGTR